MRQLTLVETNKLEWLDVAEPRRQDQADALVRPIAVARCDVDIIMAQGRTPFRPPIAYGHEFIAEVIDAGEEVEVARVGQRVAVPFQISCGDCDRCRRGITNSCLTVPSRSQYGFGGSWGGALSDLVRVPFANHMLLPVPGGIDAAAITSVDNLPDGWRTVGPYLTERPGVPVLVVGGGALSVGLYAAAIAVALGASTVDYVDSDDGRLDLARTVGANPIKGPPPRHLGPYPITVDASANPSGLACALRSTEPGGVCTSVGIYFNEETPVPLFEMYGTGVTFKTGRVNARADLPHVLELVATGDLHPEQLTTQQVSWEDAAEAWLEPGVKLVAVR